MSGVWITLAILCIVVGAVGWVAVHGSTETRRAKARLARMTATPTSTVALAPLDEIVELVGAAVPIADVALVEAPLSGTRCLWWRASISETKGSEITSLVEDSDACDFHLDDGSGVCARVRTSQAKVGLTTRNTDPAFEERARRFLAKHKIDKPIDDLVWFEERIDPRTDVYVLGHSRATDPASQGSPFRLDGGARERFVVEAPDGGELVVSVGHEALLAAKLEKEIADGAQTVKSFRIVFVIVTLVVVGLSFEVLREMGRL